VFIISYGYSRIIEQFPSGGGGYVVASKLLHRVGLVSVRRCCGLRPHDHDFDRERSRRRLQLLPPAWLWKMLVAFAGIALLTLLNVRGERVGDRARAGFPACSS
jgi:hypothetical protein